ncbi:MAG: PadR family transcriptional regulator, partial [Nonomuraea sp.]|nr:PadR family transcriptional regulator [Nonomuraea sp.]
IALLKERVHALEGERARITATAQEGRRPRNATESFALRAAQAAGEAAWIRDLIARLEQPA